MLIGDGGGVENGPTGGFWYWVVGALSAGIVQAANMIRDFRRGKAEYKSLETDTSLKATNEVWKLYNEQRDRADRLQMRCDELQKRCDGMQDRLDEIESKFAAERRSWEQKLWELSERVRHCEKFHKTLDLPQGA